MGALSADPIARAFHPGFPCRGTRKWISLLTEYVVAWWVKTIWLDLLATWFGRRTRLPKRRSSDLLLAGKGNHVQILFKVRLPLLDFYQTIPKLSNHFNLSTTSPDVLLTFDEMALAGRQNRQKENVTQVST